MALHSHGICVADSVSSRHLWQVGSFVNPSLKSCPLKWQCSLSNLTTHLKWSLFSFNRSFVLLTEGLDINPFASYLFPQSLSTDLDRLIEQVGLNGDNSVLHPKDAWLISAEASTTVSGADFRCPHCIQENSRIGHIFPYPYSITLIQLMLIIVIY